MIRLMMVGLLLTLGCHRTETREAQPTADIGHRAHIVAGVNCTRCHQNVEDDTGVHLPTNAICVDCHKGDKEAHKTDPKPNADCLSCHMNEEAEAALTHLKQGQRFKHAKHLDEVKGDCVRCHGAAGHGGDQRTGVIPMMSDCAECHQPWFDGLKCANCHVDLIRYPLQPVTVVAHAGNFLRRHGADARKEAPRCATCHTQSFCADCHNNRSPTTAAGQWPDRPDRAFIHRPHYVERHAVEARIEGPLCLTCHGESDCQSCHTAAGRGPGGLDPHPPGWSSMGRGGNAHAQAARRDILSCAGCHSGPGADLCVTCHAPGRPGGTPHLSRPSGDLNNQPCVRCHGGAR
jgi:hypothetical protein